MEKEQQQKMIPVSLIGPSNVGKTRLIKFLCEIQYNHAFTIGVDCSDYTFDSNKKVRLWDNAGQERYRTVVWEMNKRFSAFILMFDLSDGQSFQQVQAWYNQLKEKVSTQNPIIYALGNKTDLPRTIEKDFIEHYWIEEGIQYNQISVINNGNTRKIVERILSEIWYKSAYLKVQKGIKLDKNDVQEKKKVKRRCC